MATEQLSITDFQRRVLEFPEEVNLALLGGRGGGKSTACGLLALRYAELYKERAKMLFIRRSYAGLRDFEDLTRTLFATAYAGRAKYNSNEHCWTLPNGAFFELAQLDNYGDLQKFQGRSFGVIIVDEIGQFPSTELPDLLRGGMRGSKGQPVRLVYGANPGNIGQAWLCKRFVLEHEPWKPFQNERGEWWVYCPSTLFDNPHLDQAGYKRQLEAACGSDPELLAAWLRGDFTSQTGAYFALAFEMARNVVGPFKRAPKWPCHIALDFGSSAPSVCYLLAESPGAEFEHKYYPRGSILAVDEYAVYRRDDLSKGLNWSAATLAEALVEWCRGWRVAPTGCADDACFAATGSAAGSIADELNRGGLCLSPARKGSRVAGWQKMRRLLSDGGKLDRGGLYISRSCTYLLDTLPFIGRDPKRPEDVDSSGCDHGCDALRYGLLYQRPATELNLQWAT